MTKKLGNVTSTMILLLVIVLSIILLLPHFFGVKTYAVVSGSMEPALPTGSLAYVKISKPEEIFEGDIITYSLSENSATLVTHRVFSIEAEKEEFITRGDANKSNDSPVAFNRLVGKVIFSIPKLGYLTVYLKTKQGILAITFLFIASILVSMAVESKNTKYKKRRI